MHDAFSFIAEKAKNQRFILVIDEFPYLVHSNKSIKSILQNIIDHEMKDTGIFLVLCGSQISFMERQELREPAMYNSVISAVATGSSRMNDISTKIAEEAAKSCKYVKTLLDLRILRKEVPFGENPERSRKTVYQIADNCFRFWYKYVFMHTHGIETGAGRAIAESLVFPELSAFIGKPAFEDACRQYIIRKNKENALPFLSTRFGTWWGADNQAKQLADIDIVADNKPLKKALLCECKWRNEATDVGEVKKLLGKSRLLPGYNEYQFMFFSKSPYTDAALELAQKNGNLQLVSVDMLFE